ncbi:hypothetical protein DFP72DRAFT_558231 [Ephemerocybe angulata]|uniref:Uncharacterized protein n=1 Tax=Ephemerocybe angulata TaxID=980116 RepID=A0A8H6IC86_9AGAR|nr:hypothetical protein DFP72DRAFT_558231 [Tulosesus angulatus]
MPINATLPTTTTMDEPPRWTPPVYDITKAPSTTHSFKLSSSSSNNSTNFARTAKIAPDGSSFIAQCEDHSLQLFDFPHFVAPGTPSSSLAFHYLLHQHHCFIDSNEAPSTSSSPRLNLKQGSPVVDFAWFPSASKLDPATYCFVSSVRECPVKLLDASTGKLRASYRIVDHRERQIAPNSLAFTYSGERLYCGFEDAIEVFDVGCPGEGIRRHTSPSKKSKDGLKGIVSALAFSASHSVSDDAIFAAGSLTPIPGNIALYSDAGGEALMFLGGGPRAGVTQLQFNLYRPHMLYAGYRGNANGLIYSWDIRSRIDTPVAIYDGRPSGQSLDEPSPAPNQKLRFDMDIGGRYIGAGNWGGEVVLFNAEKVEAELEATAEEMAMEDDVPVIQVQPELRFKAHDDTVAAVTFQPWRAEMLTVSGSRHFDSGEEDEDTSDEEEDSPHEAGRLGPKVLDNSIKLWSLAPPAFAPLEETSASIPPEEPPLTTPPLATLSEPSVSPATDYTSALPPRSPSISPSTNTSHSATLEWELDLD